MDLSPESIFENFKIPTIGLDALKFMEVINSSTVAIQAAICKVN